MPAPLSWPHSSKETAMATRYYITLPAGTRARGADPDLTFKAISADGFASELQAALRTDNLFQRWSVRQDLPDKVDERLAATAPHAPVTEQRHDHHNHPEQPN